MKLYTEEQVKSMLNRARIFDGNVNENFVYILSDEDILLSENPIELPSEEKIEKEAVYFSDSLSIYDSAKDDTWYGFREGAKWVIERIKKQK